MATGSKNQILAANNNQPVISQLTKDIKAATERFGAISMETDLSPRSPLEPAMTRLAPADTLQTNQKFLETLEEYQQLGCYTDKDGIRHKIRELY